MKLIVIFGLPGAGKSFVGKVLQNDFGFYLYEGDQDMPHTLKTAIENQTKVSDAMRDEFFTKLIVSTKQLQKQHENIVITQTFIKERYRKQFLQAFTQAMFILVTADQKIREKRLMERKEWQLDLEYWRKMANMFEYPQVQHITLENNNEGEESLKKQLKALQIDYNK